MSHVKKWGTSPADTLTIADVKAACDIVVGEVTGFLRSLEEDYPALWNDPDFQAFKTEVKNDMLNDLLQHSPFHPPLGGMDMDQPDAEHALKYPEYWEINNIKRLPDTRSAFCHEMNDRFEAIGRVFAMFADDALKQTTLPEVEAAIQTSKEKYDTMCESIKHSLEHQLGSPGIGR